MKDRAAQESPAGATVHELAALSAVTGLELGAYRCEHVAQAVGRALRREHVDVASDLVRVVARDAGARTRFRRSVAVSVSGFFRDPAQFALLEFELLPRLLERRGTLTAWSAGCADGSELYSLALVLERLGALDRSFLLGSDVLEENVELARAGVYPDVAVAGRLRSRARWERRDLVTSGTPPGRWRLILCRNVAIYLGADAKRTLHATLARSLAPGGVLLLGRSERIFDPASVGLRRVAPHAYERIRDGR